MRFSPSSVRAVVLAGLSLLHSTIGLAQDRGAAVLAPLVQGLGVSARVLMIAAHPDDEDTQLITWLARGRQVETAYLSLTRGDGGQNLIGNELGEALGAIRTEELLAARRLDGGRQYFTRAYDFGFSKNAEETLTQWVRDSILRDVVTVVRQFRPHVVVAVFSGTPADGHGHHQASGIFAREAYDAAGDTVRFPRSATAGFGPWTVAKFYRAANFRMQDQATVRLNVGEFNPVLGRSYNEIASDSRSQHKSQAMGSLQQRGVRFDQLIREASRAPGAPADPKAERGLLDGIDTTWARFAPLMKTPAQRALLDSLPAAFAQARASLDLTRPGRNVPALVRVARLLSALCAQPAGAPCADSTAAAGDFAQSHRVAVRRTDAAVVAALGLSVEATAAREVWATGDSIPVALRILNRGEVPVTVVSARLLDDRGGRASGGVGGEFRLAPDSARADMLLAVLAQPTQPWWLRTPRDGAMFTTPTLGIPETGRPLPASVAVEVSVERGVVHTVQVPVVFRYADPIRGEINRPIAAAPAITLTLDDAVSYAQANAPLQRAIRVYVRSHASAPRDVAVRLQLPAGLVADSAERRVSFPGNASQRSAAGPGAAFGIGGGAPPELVRALTFTVRGRLTPGRHVVSAIATSGGETFTTGYTSIAYDHIRTQRLYRPATSGIEAVDVQLPRALSIAYIAGVGDNVAPMLEQLGIEVSVLDPAALPRTDLSRFGAVVVGTRAYEAHEALVANNARLLDYARNGGTLVVQYGQYEMTQPGIMPYPITLARPADRVTVEGAPVTVIDSSAAILASPNTITARDFEGWIQDRSLYMPRTFDPAYRAVFETNDPGETPNRGAVLVAPLGKGTYVYTTLAFFRQLPNGNPGAARLMVNLLSARVGVQP